MTPDCIAPPPTTARALAARILVVEDDPIVRRLLRHRFHRAGLRVTAVACGEDAVRAASSAVDPFHVVVTDGVMPGMDGFEVARHFERTAPSVPVVMISGFLAHFTSRPDIPGNIQAFFEKPFFPSEVLAKIEELLGARV
ncbi:cell cycle two-component system response regulator CpdR [Opitutales bacterium ASA1]|uniref:response regulator n=1 Tax=Congregicoccus parvus TaxID=3081749 RepID=UPI002B2B4569|nr:cell cycle two-component system response regulator CpdR [Opitutales bacterium ASA1]